MAVEAPLKKMAASLAGQLADIARDCGGEGGSCEKMMREAAAQQRPLIAAVLDEKMVDETRFLQAVAAWLQVPW